jgi:cytochrome P450
MADAPEFAFNLFDDAVKADPYPLYAEMRAAGPIVSNPMLLGQYMVARYDDVIALLNDPVTFSNARLGGSGGAANVLQAPTMLNSDPPDHDRLRSVVSRAFTPRSVSSMEPMMRALSAELLAPLADGAELDVVTELAEKVPVQVIAQMLGVSTDDLEDFTTWSHGLLGVLDPFGSPEKTQLAHDCSKQLHDYFAEEVERRRVEPTTDDLVGRMVAANEGGQLSEVEMLSACVLLLLGGNETTTKLITNAALALHRNPDERRRLAADPTLLPTAVDELLRYDTPVQGNARITTCDTTFAGVDLPAGSLVVGLLGAANHDDAKFDDPGRLDLGRDPNPHLSFSRGIHFCLGANLARLEARAVLGELMAVAPEFELVDDESALEYGATFFFHAPKRLRIRR